MSMIVWMHIWGNNSYGFTPPLLLNSLISTIYVPIFFVLSGFLQSIRNIDLMPELKKKAKSVLRPFLIVYVVSFGISFFLDIIGFGTKHEFELWNFLNPIFSKTFFNGPIWFLLALFWAFAMFYCIMKICQGREWLVVILTLSVGVTGFYMHRWGVTLPLFMCQGMVACPLLMLGSEIRKYIFPLITRNKWMTVACMMVGLIIYLLFRQGLSFQGNSFHGYFCLFLLGVFGGSMAILCFSKLLEEYMGVFAYWGKYSLVVLCFHNYVLIPSVKVTGEVISSSILWSVTNFIIIYIAFGAIIPLISRVCPGLFNIKKNT